jgi:hypothetical protein
MLLVGTAGEVGPGCAEAVATEGEEMSARMAIFANFPDLDEMGSDVCFGMPTPGSEELGPEVAAGEGVVP